MSAGGFTAPRPASRTTFVIALVLIGFAGLFFLKEQEKNEKIRVQKELAAAVSVKDRLEGDLKELQRSASLLEEKAAAQEAAIGNLKAELDEQKALRAKAQADLVVKEAEAQDLRIRLRRLEDDKRDVEARLEKHYEDYYNLKTQLGMILKTKEELEAKAKELAENGPVSLGTIVVRSGE